MATRFGPVCLLCLCLLAGALSPCCSGAILSARTGSAIVVPDDAHLTSLSSQGFDALDLDSLRESADGRVAIIVKLKTSPLVSRESAVSRIAVSNAEAVHQRVANKLMEIEGRAAGVHGRQAASVAHPPILHFYRAYSGLAARVFPETVAELRKLAEVDEIYPDTPVRADLSQTVPLIHADDMRRLGFSGQGVMVAVIDTGIDYRHPDLGGGFGPGYRIVGGYDFVHRDSDPMDDQGHGTHCAGIIAAKGVMTGVTPEAHLLASRVTYT